jgi:glycosyltransferase involved in cell wall biosynthesis
MAVVAEPSRAPGQAVGSRYRAYGEVFRAFTPLLAQWGRVERIRHPESQLDFGARRAHQKHERTISLSFIPFPALYPARFTPHAAFLLWDYPEIPHESLFFTPRPDWIRLAGKLDVILAGSRFTAEAIRRSGIQTPVEIIPIPVADRFFAVEDWNAEKTTRLDCLAYVFPQVGGVAGGVDPWVPAVGRQSASKSIVRYVYRKWVKPLLSKAVHDRLVRIVQRVEGHVPAPVITAPASPDPGYLPCASTTQLELSKIVYTAVISPSDPNENWPDLLSAYTSALRDRDDATLVMVLKIGESRRQRYLHKILGFYLRQARGLRCKVAFVVGPLTRRQNLALAAGTTYYVSTSRAKGVCLSLQEFLAAGRPAIAPRHTGFADFFGADAGFVIPSHPEPSRVPDDLERRFVTTRHRIVWQSLYDHFRESYELAKQNSVEYEVMASCARQRIAAECSTSVVAPRLHEVLERISRAAVGPASSAGAKAA